MKPADVVRELLYPLTDMAIIMAMLLKGFDDRLCQTYRFGIYLRRSKNLGNVVMTISRAPLGTSATYKVVTTTMMSAGGVAKMKEEALLDASFEVVARLGDNPRQSEWANNGVAPEAWVDGVFTAPHGCCFDRVGNLYVMDWNATGRISKLERVVATP